jgi:hypothetical protein
LIGVGVNGNGNGYTVQSAEVGKASVDAPYSAAIATDCKMYISGVNSHLIWVVDGEYVSKFAGAAGSNGFVDDVDPTVARFDTPKGLFFEAGMLYIADSGNNVSAAIVQHLSVLLCCSFRAYCGLEPNAP